MPRYLVQIFRLEANLCGLKNVNRSLQLYSSYGYADFLWCTRSLDFTYLRLKKSECAAVSIGEEEMELHLLVTAWVLRCGTTVLIVSLLFLLLLLIFSFLFAVPIHSKSAQYPLTCVFEAVYVILYFSSMIS